MTFLSNYDHMLFVMGNNNKSNKCSSPLERGTDTYQYIIKIGYMYEF